MKFEFRRLPLPIQVLLDLLKNHDIADLEQMSFYKPILLSQPLILASHNRVQIQEYVEF